MTEVAYRYLNPSSVHDESDGTCADLATSGGRAAHPRLFAGFVERPTVVARALLAVARVARTRYFDPGAAARSLDPVVTSNRDVLRFESFSGCNGVYARLDLPADAVDGTFFDWGTTNVDVNQPMRNALARVTDRDPLRLAVGPDELTVSTTSGSVTERRVPLPDRWVRGFAEVSVVTANMSPVQELAPGAARRALRDLPALRTGGVTWVSWTGSTPRLTAVPDDDAVCLAAPDRLSALVPLAPLVRGLRVFAPPPQRRAGTGSRAAQASAWEVVLDGARLLLVVSPERFRGFSGEGGALLAMADVDPRCVTAAASSLQGQSAIDPDELARAAGVDRSTGWDLVRTLGAAGRVGFDLHSSIFFHRDLPFDRSAAERLQPRLLDARALVGGVRWDGATCWVDSDGTRYAVRLDDDIERCTCPWFAKHRGERGPCKHVLAALLSRGRV